MKIKNLQAVPNEIYEYYNYPIEGKCSDVVIINNKQAEAYYQAADIVYKLIVEATEDVINNKEYARFGIPDFMIPAIEYSWTGQNTFKGSFVSKSGASLGAFPAGSAKGASIGFASTSG